LYAQVIAAIFREPAMRLDEHDSQIAAAAVQVLERELADRLEEHPEAWNRDANASEEERHAFDEHDRITQIVRKLSTGGDHELFDWETEIVRTSLQRYEAVLSDAQRAASIADENAVFITSDEQRRIELARTKALLEKFPRRSS
jgi:hypothetical protein